MQQTADTWAKILASLSSLGIPGLVIFGVLLLGYIIIVIKGYAQNAKLQQEINEKDAKTKVSDEATTGAQQTHKLDDIEKDFFSKP